MILKTKVDLPDAYKIRKAADRLSLIPGPMAVYLIGHGGERDWNGGVGEIFRERLEGLYPIFVPQDDFKRPGNYRSLLLTPEELKVKGARTGIIFDTSAKEYTDYRGVFIPTSTSQSGAWVDILRANPILELDALTSVVTNDGLGISGSPIESSYHDMRHKYMGPLRFVELNLVNIRDAAKLQREQVDSNEIVERLDRGKLQPVRLQQYGRYLRESGQTNGRAVEEVVVEQLGNILEINQDTDDNSISVVSRVLRYG